jgi:hypothetical protein
MVDFTKAIVVDTYEIDGALTLDFVVNNRKWMIDAKDFAKCCDGDFLALVEGVKGTQYEPVVALPVLLPIYPLFQMRTTTGFRVYTAYVEQGKYMFDWLTVNTAVRVRAESCMRPLSEQPEIFVIDDEPEIFVIDDESVPDTPTPKPKDKYQSTAEIQIAVFDSAGNVSYEDV